MTRSMGRFLSIDPKGFEDTGTPAVFGHYTYVGNDPVNGVDPDGEFGILGAIIGGALGAGIETVTQLVRNDGDFGALDKGAILKAGVVGGVIGATGGLAGAAVSKGVTVARGSIGAARVLTSTGGRIVQGAIIGASGNAAGETATQLIENGGKMGELDGGAIAQAGVVGAIAGAAGGAAGKALQNKLEAKGFRNPTPSDLSSKGKALGMAGGTGNPKVATQSANVVQSAVAASGKSLGNRFDKKKGF